VHLESGRVGARKKAPPLSVMTGMEQRVKPGFGLKTVLAIRFPDLASVRMTSSPHTPAGQTG
jgi:hypothetical protein